MSGAGRKYMSGRQGLFWRITLVGSLRFISKLMVLLWDPMARWLMSV
jgi:hypothetical protein|tara:strand:- start:220 stop:360 length:141 start_codon:yes stop_codon:yes gene_type:complete